MATVLRDIILIDEDLCDGCGDCISSCAEGALEIVNGKARLKKERFCDGAGACLGHCPTGALTIEKREVEAYDELAVQQNLDQMNADIQWKQVAASGGSCPGSASRQFEAPLTRSSAASAVSTKTANTAPTPSALGQWPVQLTLVPTSAPYFKNADLVITADCVPFAFADYHRTFLKGRTVVVGCPKLDNLQAYVDKLTVIFKENALRSVEVLLMEVPCCGGIAHAAQVARERSGSTFPLKMTTIGIRGDVLDTRAI